VRKIGSLILSVLALTGLAKADNSFSEIDLTNFQDIPSIIDACDVPIENVGYSNSRNCRRFYITGLWGVSAATIDDLATTPGAEGFDSSANIFTAGIAGGISLERERGRLRLEAEWLQRDFYRSDFQDFGPVMVEATENWSVLANVWRDFMITERVGCYGGGGIGGGGLTLGTGSPAPVPDSTYTSSAFAWQAGGGLIYEVTDQVTFDVSYRWYQVNGLTVDDGFFNPRDTARYGSSQVMFSLRMFEPLRSLLR
jgi:opacity protein-like surface antigen